MLDWKRGEGKLGLAFLDGGGGHEFLKFRSGF